MRTLAGTDAADMVAVGDTKTPMMKMADYRSDFAAAIETAASKGGQVMPPVMEVADLVTSSLSRSLYINIARHAVSPTILNNAVQPRLMIHLRLARHCLERAKSESSLARALREYGCMLFPLALRTSLMVAEYAPRFSAGCATLLASITSLFRSRTRLPVEDAVEAEKTGGKGMQLVSVGLAGTG